MNFEKSMVFFSTNTSEDDRFLVSSSLDMRRSNDIEKYLGLPNLVGKKKRSSFQNLKDRIKKRVDSWSFRTLSQVGKEVFINVLQVIPTYSMMCFCCQGFCVMKWNRLWQDIGGKKATVGKVLV